MADSEALRAALREAETAILDVAKLIDPCGFSISVRRGIIELFPTVIRSVNGEW